MTELKNDYQRKVLIQEKKTFSASSISYPITGFTTCFSGGEDTAALQR